MQNWLYPLNSINDEIVHTNLREKNVGKASFFPLCIWAQWSILCTYHSFERNRYITVKKYIEHPDQPYFVSLDQKHKRLANVTLQPRWPHESSLQCWISRFWWTLTGVSKRQKMFRLTMLPDLLITGILRLWKQP